MAMPAQSAPKEQTGPSPIKSFELPHLMREVPIERKAQHDQTQSSQRLKRRGPNRVDDEECGHEQKQCRHNRISPCFIRTLSIRHSLAENKYGGGSESVKNPGGKHGVIGERIERTG